MEILKTSRNQRRKEREEFAHKIHPICSEFVRELNNVEDTIENAIDTLENGVSRSLFSSEVKKLELAEHLFTQRFGYTHHGIYRRWLSYSLS